MDHGLVYMVKMAAYTGMRIYRHGDRSPIEIYPNSLHNESDWPQGFGQLSTIGMQQQYALGQYIKKRYANFLSPRYKREEILVLSSETDRTIMSAQANLAGLFPPTGDQIWNPDLHWQPIPVHVVPKEKDPRLRFPNFDCARYRELLRETMLSKEFQFDYNNPCVKIGNMIKTNLFILQSVHNYTLPEWATAEVQAKLAELTVLSLSSLFGIYKTEEKARLQGGLLVKTIVEKLYTVAENPGNRKMLIYSAHDTTLGALQMALNVYSESLPPYAACQIFELYQENDGEHTVEMHFRNDTSKEPYLLTLPGCSPACPLSKFVELVSPILVDDWAYECGNVAKEKFVSPFYFAKGECGSRLFWEIIILFWGVQRKGSKSYYIISFELFGMFWTMEERGAARNANSVFKTTTTKQKSPSQTFPENGKSAAQQTSC
uniref:acid phosphatase n=1 Tax=Salvator merianae TaxID=96440 RepID=A0A8D0BMF9_SALMN